MTTDELELSADLSNYNTVKECIIDCLVREKFLTEDQGTEIKSGYAVVLVKDNWFGATIAKLINRPSTVIKVVKIV